MAAGHCDGWSGIVRYAFATSRVAASEPGGSLEMSKYMIENLPQVVGKSLALINELIEGLGNWGSKECGKEKFCIKRNFS
jgi:hypothetical protein